MNALIVLTAVLVVGVILGLLLFAVLGKLHEIKTVADQNNTEILHVVKMLENDRLHEHDIHEATSKWQVRSEYEMHLLLRIMNRLLSGNLQTDGDENHLELKTEIGEALKIESHV